MDRKSGHALRIFFRCPNFSDFYGNMSHVTRKPVFGIWDPNRPAQLMRLARVLKFRLQHIKVLYYPGHEQQRRWSHCMDAQTDLRLCCSHMAKADFLVKWLILLYSIAVTLAGGKDDANKHLELGKQMLSSGNLLDALSHFDSAVSKFNRQILLFNHIVLVLKLCIDKVVP